MPDPVDHFITRWESSGAAERANYALFLSELCDLLDVPRPDPAALSACFGRANKKREEQIPAILETLRGLGL